MFLPARYAGGAISGLGLCVKPVCGCLALGLTLGLLGFVSWMR